MNRWLNQANHFFELPLTLRSRGLILVAFRSGTDNAPPKLAHAV